MMRIFCIQLFAALLIFLPFPAVAQVQVTFHSFSGSFFGRYPHAFVSLSGTLEGGSPIQENYGFSAVQTTPAVLLKPVRGTVFSEKPKYINTTNRHFTVPITDAQYWAIRAEIPLWRDGEKSTYRLDDHNCLHFVSRIAELAGLRAGVPREMVRKPKVWLDYVIALNLQLRARAIP